jgi:hypothetical protein
MRLLNLACLCGISCFLALAQPQDQEVHHHNISFGAGPAMAVGNATNYLSTAPSVRLSYGYRFNRLFQADAGFEMAFGAANNQNPETTTSGYVSGGDHEFMAPLLGVGLGPPSASVLSTSTIPKPLHPTAGVMATVTAMAMVGLHVTAARPAAAGAAMDWQM